MPGRLILCATPIGNLEDAPPRLASELAEADIVYAEDTRRTRVLLQHLGIDADVRSYFVGNEHARAIELGRRLGDGETAVLVTDAGMPGIADPGLSAVQAAIEAGVEVTVVPGASAVTAALAVSGLPADRFVFEGFLPRKPGQRARRLGALSEEPRTIVFFAAPSRVAEDLTAIAAAFGGDRRVAVARELTKLHEEVFRGTAMEAARRWTEDIAPRGEFTLVVEGALMPSRGIDELVSEVGVAVEAGHRLSAAVKDVADRSGTSRRVLYEAALKARDDA